jgi:quinolinate synthase
MPSNLPPLIEYEKAHPADGQWIPERYLGLSEEELDARIAAAKATLGRRVVILGHHYQRDEVIKFADFTGDSLKLSRRAADTRDAEYIVFCGVHFMAESADLLCASHQQVILPDLAAGCTMADMVAIDQLECCWDDLARMGAGGVLPCTYINSSAAVKAFCGEHGGIVCTSSNASPTLRWAWERSERVLFLPDQHLGRNTAFALGVPLDQMAVWDPNLVQGGLAAEQVRQARIILWKGHCAVHQAFTVAHIERVRARHPGIRVIVHPEVRWEVAQAADDRGSTEYIVREVTESPAGTAWAVGTEVHLVNRLAQRLAPEKLVISLDEVGCLCSTMFRVSPNHLLWVLEGLLEGEVHNRVRVGEPQKHWAKIALDRMLLVH